MNPTKILPLSISRLFSLLILICYTSLGFASEQSDFEKGKAAYQAKNWSEAFYLFRKAAEAGDANAQLYLGSMYRSDEEGIKQDHEKMFYWWNKAADLGNARAAYAIAKWNNPSFGEMVWEKDDYSEIIPLYERAANLGNAASMYWLAQVYGKKQQVHANPDLHFQWIEKAAKANNTAAQYRLAEMYGQGEYVTQNNGQSLIWLEKAAQLNNAKAQLRLAIVHYRGMMGIPFDKEKGLYWMTWAAYNGEEEAYFELGMRHVTGDGAPKDPQKGYLYFIELMKKAEDKKLRAKVSYRIGEIYAMGGFGETDPVSAYSWFEIAKQKGNPKAQQAQNFIQQKHSVDPVKQYEAREQAKRCIKTNYKTCRPKTEEEIQREVELLETIWEAMHPKD